LRANDPALNREAGEMTMADSCNQCGAALGEHEVFCTRCGARRSQVQASIVEKHFCGKCGAELKPDLRFCEACGNRIEPAAAPDAGFAAANQPGGQDGTVAAASGFQPVRLPNMGGGGAVAAGTPSFTPAVAVMPSVPMPPPKKSHTLAKILISVMIVIFLIVGGVVGAGIYIGYRIKKKAEQVEQSYKKALAQAASQPSGAGQPAGTPDLGKLLGALGQAAQSSQSGSGGQDLGKILQALSQGQSGSSPDLAKLLTTLGHGLQGASGGSVEKRPAGTCAPANQKALVSYLKDTASASIPLEDGLTLTDVWTPRADQPDVEILTTVNSIAGNSIQVMGKRLVGNDSPGLRNLCTADLLDAREYETQFGPSTPNTIPGATMFTLSHAVFSDLKAGRPAALTFYDAYNDPAGGYDLQSLSKGTLSRVETSDVPYSIIVNGEKKDLPTLHVKGTLGSMIIELWVLDDVNNPLVVNLKADNSPFHITYVKITFPEKKEVEQQLAQTGRADIYGIYFDFDKGTPRPESAPVLKEIAQALKDNPNWKLEIEGYTDNVGGDAYNQNLSDKRAQGVAESLVSGYGIASDRLTSKGFGATQPKATNDTPEGRALNRRVELVRD
jgi:outer membrane protein OmpA-like peptidoglycan-associated protein/type II secretory pathway pseudopilin PulG